MDVRRWYWQKFGVTFRAKLAFRRTRREAEQLRREVAVAQRQLDALDGESDGGPPPVDHVTR
jgi:hypothetical protein